MICTYIVSISAKYVWMNGGLEFSYQLHFHPSDHEWRRKQQMMGYSAHSNHDGRPATKAILIIYSKNVLLAHFRSEARQLCCDVNINSGKMSWNGVNKTAASSLYFVRFHGFAQLLFQIPLSLCYLAFSSFESTIGLVDHWHDRFRYIIFYNW